MKKLILLICFFLSQLFYLNAQVGIKWATCYGGSRGDVAESIQQTTDGGFIVVGYTGSIDGDVTGNHGYTDYWVIKIDVTGVIQWQKCYGGLEEDIATSVQQTTDGGYIVVGYTGSIDGDVTGNHGGFDYWIIKLDEVGNLEWQRCYGGIGNDYAYSIQQSVDGGYIVAGYTYSNDGDILGNHGEGDYWIVKIDINGNMEWQKCYGGSSIDIARSINQTIDGGYIVAGCARSNDGDISGSHGGGDYWIVKIDETSNLEWQKCYGGSEADWAIGIEQTIDGGYIVAGSARSNDGDVTGNNGYADYWVIEIDVTGVIEWQKCYGGTEEDVAFSIQQTVDGGSVVAGHTRSNDGDVTGNYGELDYWVIKLEDSGVLEWQKCYGGGGVDQPHSIQQTTDGGYVVAGQKDLNEKANLGLWPANDFWVVRLCQQTPLSIEVSNSNYCFSTELIAGGDFESYLWCTSETTQYITITNGGQYSVIGYNEIGCPTEVVFIAPYPLEPYNQSQICMVTLDEGIGKNTIVYEPDLNVGIDSILFYRLNNQTSEFEWIGSNSINSPGLFIDQESTPAQQNHQYRIAVKDTCSKTSELSPMHRTILLQANTGVNQEVNLFWNAYTGFDYSNFGIYRSVDGGEYFLIANVPNNTYTYIDLSAPSGEKKYQIRVEKDPPCNPERNTYSFVGSNPVIIQPFGITDNELENIKVYPNPFNDNLIIERTQGIERINIELIDVYGRLLDTFSLKSGETTLTISTVDLLPGVYYLRLNQITITRIVKQ